MIAHITATFPPYWAGTGNVAYHNARLLHEQGHDVTVFTASTSTDGTMAFPFPVVRLPPLFRLGNAPFTPRLLKSLRGFKLLHLHYPYIFGTEFALLAARYYRIPLVVTYHNRLTEDKLLKRFLFGIYNATAEPTLLCQATRLLAVRREHFLSLFPQQPFPVEELSNGVDTDLFAPVDKAQARAALGLQTDAPIALFVGALDQAHRFKNLHGLLEAFANVPLQNARLHVVGEGNLRPSLEAHAHELGLASRVRFFGACPPEALPVHYSAADVTVLPSTHVESFGLVILESLACATPVIASDLPGVRTLIETQAYRSDGLLVPPRDLQALGRALTDLLGDPLRARRMGSNGRQHVLVTYDWRIIGQRLEHLYQEVLGA